MDRFSHLGSCVSLGGRTSQEMSSQIQKDQMAFGNLRHLWRRRGIRLSTKSLVHRPSVKWISVHNSKNMGIGARCAKIVGFETAVLVLLAEYDGRSFASNSKARQKVLGPRVQYLGQVLKHTRLGRLGRALRMSTERLRSWALLPETVNNWRISRGG